MKKLVVILMVVSFAVAAGASNKFFNAEIKAKIDSEIYDYAKEYYVGMWNCDQVKEVRTKYWAYPESNDDSAGVTVEFQCTNDKSWQVGESCTVVYNSEYDFWHIDGCDN